MTNTYWPTSVPDGLGGMVGADDVRDNVKATILQWSPFYIKALSARLASAGRIGGRSQPPNPLPAFDTWVNEPDYRSFGSGQPAAFLVLVPGTVGSPELRGNRQYVATWRCHVQVQVFGTSWEEAADLASWYEKVVRWCIVQHRSLGGFAMSAKWQGATYAGEQHTSTRTSAQAVLGFDIQVGDVAEAINVTIPSTTVDPTVDQVITNLTTYPVTQNLPPV